jgi:hypothetical protein
VRCSAISVTRSRTHRSTDELAGLSLELAHETLHRHRHTAHHGCDVRIDEGGDLLAVTAQTRYRAVPDHRTATIGAEPAPV